MIEKNVKKNYIYNLLNQLLLLLVPLLTTPYVARVLGAEGVGVYSYTYAVVTYFTMLSAFGSSACAQREIASVRDDMARVSKVFWEMVLLRCVMSFVSCVIYLLYAFHSARFAIAAIQSVYIAAVIFDISWFFQGLEEFKKIIFRNMLTKVMNMIFVFIFVKDKEDVFLYAAGLAFFFFLGNASVWFYLPKYLKTVKIKTLRPFRYVKGSFLLFLPTIATQIYTVFDKTMIGMFTDTNLENGYYEQAEKLAKFALSFVTSIGLVMSPRIAYTFAKNDRKALREYMYKSYHFAWFLSIPLFFGITALASHVVPWFLGEGYEKVVPLMMIFAFLIVAIGQGTIVGLQYLIPTHKQNVFTVILVGGAMVNFIMNLGFIPRFYSLGAAVASVTAETLMTAAMFFYVIRIQKAFEAREIFFPSVNYWGAGVVMFLVLLLVKQYVGMTIAGTGVLAVIGMLTYFFLLWLRKDSFFLELLGRVRFRRF